MKSLGILNNIYLCGIIQGEMDIKIDKIENDFEGYNELINFYALNKEKNFSEINLKLTGWFSAHTCSMLGAILTKLQNKLNSVNIDALKAKDILERNGFLSFFGNEKKIDYNNTTIPYQVLSIDDDRYFNNYVFKEFLGKSDLPNMTEGLKKKMTESIYEIFINAKIHSQTDKIFICGQYFPYLHKIEFMLTDIGVGIKNVINTRFNSNLTAIQAIDWAIEDRNTTKNGISGGIGLALLYEFIQKNMGKIQIVSNEGFWELNTEGIIKSSFENEFPGTMINIMVRTDDKNSYMLYDEIPEDIF